MLSQKEAYWIDPVLEGRDSGEDSGFSHLVAHARWTVTDNTVDSPGSISVAVQGASGVALGQVEIRKDKENRVQFESVQYQVGHIPT